MADQTEVELVYSDLDKTLIIDIKGELVFSNQELLLSKCKEFLSPVENIIIDLREVSFIDSSGLGCFLMVQEIDKFQGIGITLRVGDNTVVADSLKLANFKDLFKIDSV